MTDLLTISYRDYGELLDKALAQLQDGLDRDNPIAAKGACDTLTGLLTAGLKRSEQLAQLIGTLKNHPTLRPR